MTALDAIAKENQLYNQTEEMYNKILQFFNDSEDGKPTVIDFPTLSIYITQLEKNLKKLMLTSYGGNSTVATWFEDLSMFKIQRNKIQWYQSLQNAKNWMINSYNNYAGSKDYPSRISQKGIDNFINYILRYDNIDTYKNIIKRIMTRQMTSASLYRTINSVIFQSNDRVEDSIQFDYDKKLSLNEGFGDIFDSSLIDYSNDFEKQDIWYKKTLPIKNWLNKYGVRNYTINKDLTVDVDGDVYLTCVKLKKIKVQFNKVSGGFYCAINQLTSLEGCPQEVGGNFDCGNNLLTSLEGCPQKVGGNFDCGNNLLTSLEGCPQKVWNGGFYCAINQLTSLEGCPKEIDGNFDCHNNPLNSNWSKEKLKSISDIKGIINGLKSEVNESFSNVFDSSLIDYHKDFEEQDKQYVINKIKPFLEKNNITKYKINDDLSIDVDGDVIITDNIYHESHLPVNFNRVNGNFECSGIGLSTIEGFPHYVNGNVDAAFNEISSLTEYEMNISGNADFSNNPIHEFNEDEEFLIKWGGHIFVGDTIDGLDW